MRRYHDYLYIRVVLLYKGYEIEAESIGQMIVENKQRWRLRPQRIDRIGKRVHKAGTEITLPEYPA